MFFLRLNQNKNKNKILKVISTFKIEKNMICHIKTDLMIKFEINNAKLKCFDLTKLTKQISKLRWSVWLTLFRNSAASVGCGLIFSRSGCVFDWLRCSPSCLFVCPYASVCVCAYVCVWKSECLWALCLRLTSHSDICLLV